MLNEKHNDPFGWKKKLEGLTRLPGEAALDKHAAWEKLHGRLQQKPHRNKAVWYWAAACILLACIIPLMIANKKENIVVKSNPFQKQHTITPAIELQTLPFTIKAPIQVKEKQIERGIAKKQHIITKNTIKQDEPVTAIAETIVEKDPVGTIIPAPLIDTAGIVAAAVPVKKKLSVVHINELESPSAQFFPPPNYVQTPFKIKFKNGKAAKQTIASQQQYANGFKIKLSSKN